MKKIGFLFLSIGFLLTVCANVVAQVVTKVAQSNPVPIPNWVGNLETHIDAKQASFSSPEDARQFLDEFSKTHPDMKPDDKNFYCIIHVLTWKDAVEDPAKPADDPMKLKQVVDKQNYYVYHNVSST